MLNGPTLAKKTELIAVDNLPDKFIGRLNAELCKLMAKINPTPNMNMKKNS